MGGGEKAKSYQPITENDGGGQKAQARAENDGCEKVRGQDKAQSRHW
jgi:hypothetical protein